MNCANYSCSFHNQKTLFGVSFFSPSSPSSTLLELLGLSDHELQTQMVKGHGYAFNMGHNNIIPFQNFQEAARVLMERNMPDVLHNRQTKAVFMPETHIPSMPRVVDETRYQARKKKLEETALKFLQMKKGDEDVHNAAGDLVEKNLSEKLHEYYENKKVVVF